MAAVGSVLGERTNRKTKLEEDHLNAWAHLKHHYVGRSTARMQRLETELQQSPQGAHRHLLIQILLRVRVRVRRVLPKRYENGQGPKIPSFSGREDFYETLQLNHATTPLTSYSARDIAAAYRRVAVKVHPDKISADASLDERTKSLALFHKATEAYRILSDDTLRQAYDAARSERELEGNDATATTTTTTGDTGRSTRSSDQTLVSKTNTTSDYSSFQSFMCEQFGDDYAQRLRTYEKTLEEARAKAASLLESADPEERRAQLANLKAEQARKARLRRIAAEQTRDNAAWEMRAHVVRAREEKEARERANEVRRKQFIEEAFFADAKSRADARAEEQRRAKQREENSKRAQTVAAAVAAASASVDA
ncbi:hypothetical protein PPROV_000502100 [Pycnococcus provasolii]|uniref:J domain-containing protein n=1 Tax=Pycnococcus provasolii TaxID=41880 RepID=A0A830HGP5_9CHLO|nr:hypothetical protein PPROV_000502100 [Pycnococcus provasolii]